MSNINSHQDTDGNNETDTEIETITDFDFGVGNASHEFVRVSLLPQRNGSSPERSVSSPEVKLILWLLLEQSFGRIRNICRNESKARSSSESSSGFEDSDTLYGSPHRSDHLYPIDELDSASPTYQTQSDTIRGISQAEEYTRKLLQSVGINVPFNLLSEDEKAHLFNQFSESSDLLATEKYNSVLTLYEALRRRSKFRENFEVVSLLGRGKYGRVFSVRNKGLKLKTDSSEQDDNQNLYAIKQIHLTLDCLEDIKMILNEAAILKKLSGHPRIAQFHNSWLAMDSEDVSSAKDDSLVFYLQMGLHGQSLKQWKRSNRGLPIEIGQCLQIAKQILEGVVWIHSHNILHLDLNPANILWSDGRFQEVKIGDFGLGVQGSSFKGRRGTSPYCAPEDVMTHKSDVFSVGVTVFEMSREFTTLSELISSLDRRHFVTGMEKLDNAITFMTISKPANRPGASQALQLFLD